MRPLKFMLSGMMCLLMFLALLSLNQPIHQRGYAPFFSRILLILFCGGIILFLIGLFLPTQKGEKVNVAQEARIESDELEKAKETARKMLSGGRSIPEVVEATKLPYEIVVTLV